MKIVINTCYGGFGLSHKAEMRYAELKGITLYPFVEKRDSNGNLNFKHPQYEPYKEGTKPFMISYSTKPLNADETISEEDYWYKGRMSELRDDPALIQVIEEMGEEANGDYAQLKIVEIPDGIKYEIEEYDGNEWVAEKHETWR